MAEFVQQISPDQVLGYGQARRRNATTYGIQSGNANFARSGAYANQGLETGALTQQYGQNRNKLGENFAGRGLLNSGVYKQGLQDFNQQRVTAFQGLSQKYNQQIGRINMDQYGQAQQYNNANADIDEQEKVARAQLAASLRGLV